MRWARRDDAGSLPLAMLLTIVGVGVSVLLTGTVMRLVVDTRVERGRAAALQAAHTGLAAAVANVRAARTEDGTGVVDQLPCGSAGAPQVTGSVGDGVTRYESTILYLIKDPRRQSPGWARLHGTPCAGLLGGRPKFAFVLSVGVDTRSGHRRSLYGTYAFRTGATANVPGGQVRMWRTEGDSNLLCIDAGAMPAPGVEVTMQPCSPETGGPVIARQKFAYAPNLTLTLVTADLVRYPDGLCLDAGSPQVVGASAKLQLCGRSVLPQQQWNFNSASGFIGTTDGRTLNEFCLSVEHADTPGSRIVLNDTAGGLTNGNPACNTGFPNHVQSWNPQPDVGAGAAVLPVTKQIVNFEQFGRCLDVTNMTVSIPYEVVFPCKQTPDPTARDWNQQWTLPENGRGTLATMAPEGLHCLTAPPLSGDDDVLLVTVQLCPAGQPKDEMTWLIRGAETPTYDEAYRIEGTGKWAGLCLAPLPDHPWFQQGVKVGLVPCSGDRIQKWNAQPGSDPAGLSHIGEL